MSDAINSKQATAIEATVGWFSQEMEQVMKRPENLAKGTWDYCSDVYLITKLKAAVEHVQDNTFELGTDETLLARIKECADVANIAMMIASNAFHLLNELEEEESNV